MPEKAVQKEPGKKGHKEDAYAEGQVKQDFMPFKIVI